MSDADALATATSPVAEFWEVAHTWDRCPNECGHCMRCGADWAIGWSIAAESNPELVVRLRQQGTRRFGAFLVEAPIPSCAECMGFGCIEVSDGSLRVCAACGGTGDGRKASS